MLLHFATFHAKMHKPETQLTGSSLQLYYSWNSTTISSSCYGNNHHPQIYSTKEDQSPHTFKGRQIILILSIGKAQFLLFLSEHLFLKAYQGQLRTSCLSALFVLVPSNQGSARQDTVFSRDVYYRRIMCKNLCFSVTKGKLLGCRSSLLHFHALNLNLKYQ